MQEGKQGNYSWDMESKKSHALPRPLKAFVNGDQEPAHGNEKPWNTQSSWFREL